MYMVSAMQCLVANLGVLEVSRILGNPAILQSSLICPLIRVLGLPRPLNPAVTALVGNDLSLPVLPEELLVVGAKGGSVTGLGGAAADGGGTWVGSVVA